MTDSRTPGLAGHEVSSASAGEEARKQVEAAEAELKKQVAKARKQFAYNLKLAQDRLADAERELAAIAPKRAALEPFRNNPEGALHFTNLELLSRIYGASKRMMEIQVACHQHNLAIVETEPMPERPEYRIPESELAYMELRAFSDLTLAAFHWLQLGEGIDILLRASGNGRANEGETEDDEFLRRTAAESLAAKAQQDRSLAVLIGQLGAELKETRELIEWGTGALNRLAELSGDEKRQALEVPQWAKLSGKVALLGTLPDRVRHVGAVADRMPRVDNEPLPYEQVAWVAEDASKGDRLTITGRLGPKGK